MSQGQNTGPGVEDRGGAEMHSALFAQLVMQQANLAMMLLGKTPNPESGKVEQDIEAARLFIDQLEMLEAKTKGNLTKEEAGLLKQTLMSLHLAFVEAVDSSQSGTAPNPPPPPPSGAKSAPESAPAAGSAPPTDAKSEEEHHKKFSKKY